ncbi:AraC family transcriptional regulator [Lentilactobacillus diolivorans]|uniref:AraC family transcriptional regulator n=1 Tax=Lentilactobacillus diolivorans TaxID=179838 RepID=UPI002469A3AD|nr:AraC family transcriptional regulator [Lentilactobacillus diolivorans]MDH5106350.1 AraC family transcriptional regulator [Lentilactobacillus diolivorans]
MLFFPFTLEKTLLYYQGGEFTSTGDWQLSKGNNHGDYELIFCIEGPIYLQIDQTHYVLNSGDLLLIPPFKDFGGYQSSPRSVSYYWIRFFSQARDNMFQEDEQHIIDEMRIDEPANNRIVLPVTFKLADPDQTIVLINQILAIYPDSSPLQERDYLTSALLIKLFKHYVSQNGYSEENARIRFLKEWIRANMSNNLTVREISARVDLNPDYLTRLFKGQTGMTLHQYLNHLKIEVATLLLVRTDMPINQIATNAYFNDPRVFMRHFKKSTGVTPSEYRKSYDTLPEDSPNVDAKIPIPKRIADLIDYVPENGDIPE